VRLRVVTFNVKDRLLAGCRRLRMSEAGRALGALRPDVVGLQEAFSERHRRLFLEAMERAAGERFESAYFPSGPYGSGLMTASRLPIGARGFHRFSRNGSWLHLNRGDRYAGKGVGWTLLRLPGGGRLDLFNVHAIARYGFCDDDYLDDRRLQMGELRAFVEATRDPAAPGILLGDLNCFRGDPEYRIAVAGDGASPPFEPLFAAPAVDHVFGLAASGVRYAAGEALPLTTAAAADGRRVLLSDHVGWCLTVELTLGA